MARSVTFYWCFRPAATMVVLMISHACVCIADSNLTIDFLHRKSEYHLTELVNTLNQLETSHRLYKRDARRDERTINISNSLKDICFQLATQSLETSATMTLNSNDIFDQRVKNEMEKNISFLGNDHPSRWPKPELRVLSVEASREGKTSHLTFNVMHSSHGFVVRTLSLDFFNTTFGAPGKYSEPVITQVLMSVDTHRPQSQAFSESAQYTFGLVDDKSYIVEVDVDPYHFDKIRTNVDYRKGTFQMKTIEGETFSQQVTPVNMRVLLPSDDVGNEIVITPGQDSEFYIDMTLYEQETYFEVRGLFWDWNKEQFIKTDASVISYENYPPTSQNAHGNNVKVEIVHVTELTTSRVDEENKAASFNYRTAVIRARVTIDTTSALMSGRLTLRYSCFNRHATNNQIVRGVLIEKDVSLKLPYKMSTLPPEVMTGDNWEQICRNDSHPHSINECIIECSVIGNDIKSIFIVKNDPYVPPVKSVSYVLNGKSAISFLDMGPPSPDINGTYACVVVTNDGKVKTTEGTVISVGLSVIHSALVKDMGNGSSQISCVASGSEPLSISFSLRNIYYNTEELNLGKAMEIIDDKTSLEVLLPTERLLFPITTVICKASGGQDSDTKSVDVSWYIESYNSTAPIVKPDLFTMKHFENGTTRITCTASGGKDVVVDIMNPDYHYAYDDYSISEINTRDGKTIVLYLPTRFLSRLSHELDVSCKARNSRGSQEINIDSANIEEY